MRNKEPCGLRPGQEPLAEERWHIHGSERWSCLESKEREERYELRLKVGKGHARQAL